MGRKPVLLFGSTGLCIAMPFLGLSRTFSQLVLSRLLLAGMLNGNAGLIRTM
ncbi:hypothetical protein J3R82DRAFT_3548 [Butyriboletus roseoflavus]|nr:hypothetical protein J3R82DRAFT_3548 [Butyriboletus roseoflavus]